MCSGLGGHWAQFGGKVEGIVGRLAMTPAVSQSGHLGLATSWMSQWGLFCLGEGELVAVDGDARLT